MNLILTKNQIRILGILGASAPIIYVIATVIGGLLWPSYSHYSNTISTLTSVGAPNQFIIVPLFAIYNFFILLLSIGVCFGVKEKKALWGSVFLFITGIVGLILFWYPQDFPQGPPTTFTGTIHIILAAIIAFTSIASMIAYGFKLRNDSVWGSFSRFSFIWLLIVIVLGIFGATSITTPYAGFAERLSIVSILIWIEALSLKLIRRTN